MNKTLFHDYDGFVEKFKPKKTTDDCYTPQYVYDAVLQYVGEVYDLSGLTVRRPFKPEGDYQAEAAQYTDRDIVIDNPPFSCLAQIRKFYEARNIKYFLFAPHLTLFGIKAQTSIVTLARIIYENGANIPTDFISNLFGDIRIMTAPRLYELIDAAQKKAQAENKKELPKYTYPANTIRSTQIERFAGLGLTFEIKADECHYVSKLQSQRSTGSGIFGGGYLISSAKAKELAAKELAAKETIFWPLSEQEHAVIALLDAKNTNNE